MGSKAVQGPGLQVEAEGAEGALLCKYQGVRDCTGQRATPFKATLHVPGAEAAKLSFT
jgi:hypothetical protein